MANVFITSDLHFGHKNILKYNTDTRPWASVQEMNESLIEHWNSNIKEQDVVYHLGDFSFLNKEQTQAILSRLNGKVVWVRGNHDQVLDKLGVPTIGLHEVSYKGVDIVMCHFPMVVWNKSHRGSIHLFGHCHGSYQHDGRAIDVGWDARGRIMSLDEAVEVCLTSGITTPTHHMPGGG